MLKFSSLGGFVCLMVVAQAGCRDLPSDNEVPDLDGDDSGTVIDPVLPKVITEHGNDAGALADAMSQPGDAGSSVDAAPSEPDAESDAGVLVPDSGTQEDAGPLSAFASMYAVVTESCVGCHGAGKTLDLSTPELTYAGLVGVAAQYAACLGDSGMPPVRVVAGSVETSLLIAKLEGTQSCGKQMPPRALLEAEKIELFRAWVAAGAPAQ